MGDTIEERLDRARRMLDRIGVQNPNARTMVLNALTFAYDAGVRAGVERAQLRERERVSAAVEAAIRHSRWIAGLESRDQHALLDAMSRRPQ